MGTICILLGIIVLILAILGGFFIAHAIIGNQLYMSLLAISEPAMLYVYVVGALAFVGLLICLLLVMLGMTYNKTCKNNEMLKRITRS